MNGAANGQPASRVRAHARLALTRAEAAESLGAGLTFFDEHVMPSLRVVRRGRRVLVPVRELERWLEREAALTVNGAGK